MNAHYGYILRVRFVDENISSFMYFYYDEQLNILRPVMFHGNNIEDKEQEFDFIIGPQMDPKIDKVDLMINNKFPEEETTKFDELIKEEIEKRKLKMFDYIKVNGFN